MGRASLRIASSNRTPDAGLGARLKQIRQERALTLAEVGRRTGVSVSNLSKIENSQISPSFDVLKRISDGLGISIEEFVRSDATIAVSGRKAVNRRHEGERFTSGQYDYRALAGEITRKAMVPLEIVVRARRVEEFDHWSQHRGEEFVYVLAGTIEVHTEQYAPFRLGAGECAYFDSNMRHLFLAVGKDEARVLSVSHDPGAPAELISRFMSPGAEPVK